MLFYLSSSNRLRCSASFLRSTSTKHKYNEVRSSYGDILLSIADFRIAGKEISGSSRNVNKQANVSPVDFLIFFITKVF